MRTNEGKETTQIRIQQMDCPTEEGLIRKKLNDMKGVSGLQFNLMNRVLTVSYPKGMLPEIVAAIKSLDYTPEVLEANERPKLSEFRPTMPGENRERLLQQWRRAIERARRWEEE